MSDCNETKEELEIRRAASLEVLGISAPIPPVTPSQQARPLDEWDEWNGNVLWWKFPIDEPPYVGTPLDTDWPKYHTHWTPLGVPDMPLPAPIPPTVTPSQQISIPIIRYKELIDCLEAMASGKGGWAWEDVLQEHQVMLDDFILARPDEVTK